MPQQSRIEIPWPRLGLNEDNATGKQPPLTAREFENVRTIDPKTGRSRGGQRPGHTRFLADPLSGANKVQNLNMALEDIARVTYNELGDSPASGDEITEEWSKVTPSVSVAYGVDVDRQGNVYVLDGDNSVRKYNSDGELVHTIFVRTEVDDQLARRLVVDEFDNIYVGVFSEEDATGPTGKIVKYRPVSDEDGKYAVHWEQELEGSIADFAVRFGVMGVVENRTGSGDTGDDVSYLVAFEGILSSIPVQIWERAIPYPGNALDIGDQGAFYTTHQASADRGLGGDPDFTTTAVDWVPHELTNADQRLHFWLDVEELDGFSHNEFVMEWPDTRRFHANYSAVGGSDLSASEPLDDTDRKAVNSTKWSSIAQSGARPPVYRVSQAGTKPTLRFDGTDETRLDGSEGDTFSPGRLFTASGYTFPTDQKLDSTPTEHADGKMAKTFGPFIGQTGYNYFICMVVNHLANAGQASIIMSTRGSYASTKHVAFAYGSSDATTDADATNFTTHQYQLRGNVFANFGSGSTNHPLEFDSSSFAPEVMILTYVDNQGTPGSAISSWRVNGRAVDRFDQSLLTTGIQSVQSIGHAQIHASSNGLPYTVYRSTSFGSTYDPDGWRGMNGDIMEIISVLADSSVDTSPHDQDVDQPIGGVSGLPPIFGENSGSVSAGPSAAATEIEFVEGYLAHKWGISHLLPNGDGGGADAEGLFPDHPFGGTANTPAGNGGDFGTSDDQAALFSSDPITAKWGANAGELKWALTAGGMGYGLVVDSDNAVITLGTKVAGVGPSGADESDVIGRKIIDLGVSHSEDEGTASEGTVTFTDVGNDGDTLEVGTRTYTLRTAADDAVADEVTIGGSIAATIANLEAAINVTSPSTGYSDATTRNDEVFVSATTATTVVVTAKTKGTDGDSLTFVATSTEFSVDGGGTLGGTTGGVDGDGAWTFTDAGDQKEPDYAFPQLRVDDADDVYMPIADGTNTIHLVKRAGVNGTVKTIYDIGSASIEAFGVAFPSDHPVYDVATITGPQFLYLTSDNGGTPNTATLRKLKLVAIANEGDPLNANLRQPVYVGVSAGNIVTFQRDGTATTPSGGSAALDSASPYIFSARAFRKIYYTDGVTYKVYDPSGYDATTPASGTDEVEEWTSGDSGEIPKYAKLIAFWNNRLLLGRTADEPQNWFMSKKGDADNWDFFPAVPTVLDAIAGNDSRAGLCPDIIQSFIPYSDDLLIIGGDSTIQMMTGDPADQGYFDLVSDSTGMAFGNPWCKDPEGLLYFFGSRGGVYVMAPGQVPQKLTRDTIQRRLESVDLLAYRPVLAWDTRHEGMYVYFVPYGAGGTQIDGYFWDKKHNAWSVVSFTDTDFQPTAIAVFDGDDPDDRVVVLGCEDGRVRLVDGDSRGDDNSSGDHAGTIDSYVLFGPISSAGTQDQVRFTRLEVLLANDQDGCNVEWFVSDHPDSLGDAINIRRLKGGRNPWDNKKARGSYVWVRLRNASLSQRWALERMSVAVFPAGRSRISAK